jgi:tetratricopeptide (TPR) repeat protein
MAKLARLLCLQMLVVTAALGVFSASRGTACAQTSASSVFARTALLGDVGSSVGPTDDLSPIDLADALVFHKRYQEALAKYAGVQPKTAPVWIKMGIAYQMMYDLNDAERCYKEAIKLDPKESEAFNNLGALYESQLDHRHAEKMFRIAVQIDPNLALGYKNLATCLIEEHKYKEGRAADARALILDPAIYNSGNNLKVGNTASVRDRGQMNYLRAIDCVQAGQTACALDHLRRALNQGYTNPYRVAADSNFAALAGDPGFQALLAEELNK